MEKWRNSEGYWKGRSDAQALKQGDLFWGPPAPENQIQIRSWDTLLIHLPSCWRLEVFLIKSPLPALSLWGREAGSLVGRKVVTFFSPCGLLPI